MSSSTFLYTGCFHQVAVLVARSTYQNDNKLVGLADLPDVKTSIVRLANKLCEAGQLVVVTADFPLDDTYPDADLLKKSLQQKSLFWRDSNLTRDDIQNAIDSARNLDAQGGSTRHSPIETDQLLVYMMGHGGSGKLVFGDAHWQSELLHSDLFGLDEVEAMLLPGHDGDGWHRVLVALDCCHSGDAITPGTPPSPSRSGSVIDLPTSLSYAKCFQLLTSTVRRDAAWIFDDRALLQIAVCDVILNPSMYISDWATCGSFETLASVAMSKRVSQSPLDSGVVNVGCKVSRLPWCPLDNSGEFIFFNPQIPYFEMDDGNRFAVVVGRGSGSAGLIVHHLGLSPLLNEAPALHAWKHRVNDRIKVPCSLHITKASPSRQLVVLVVEAPTASVDYEQVVVNITKEYWPSLLLTFARISYCDGAAGSVFIPSGFGDDPLTNQRMPPYVRDEDLVLAARNWDLYRELPPVSKTHLEKLQVRFAPVTIQHPGSSATERTAWRMFQPLLHSEHPTVADMDCEWCCTTPLCVFVPDTPAAGNISEDTTSVWPESGIKLVATCGSRALAHFFSGSFASTIPTKAVCFSLHLNTDHVNLSRVMVALKQLHWKAFRGISPHRLRCIGARRGSVIFDFIGSLAFPWLLRTHLARSGGNLDGLGIVDLAIVDSPEKLGSRNISFGDQIAWSPVPQCGGGTALQSETWVEKSADTLFLGDSEIDLTVGVESKANEHQKVFDTHVGISSQSEVRVTESVPTRSFVDSSIAATLGVAPALAASVSTDDADADTPAAIASVHTDNDFTAMDTGPEAALRWNAMAFDDVFTAMDTAPEEALRSNVVARDDVFTAMDTAPEEALRSDVVARDEVPVSYLNEDAISQMLIDERLFMADSQYLTTVQGNKLRPWMRQELCEWMLETVDLYRVSTDVYGLAVNLLDQCLSRFPLEMSHVQLLGATCLQIACKLKESTALSTAELISFSDNAFTFEQMRSMEHSVLERLDWRLSAVTPHDWLEVMLYRSQFFPEVSHALRHKARHFIDMALTRYVSLGFRPSLIAGAALLNAADYAAPTLPLALVGRLPAIIVQLLRRHSDRRLFECTRMLRRIIVALTQPQQSEREEEDNDNTDSHATHTDNTNSNSEQPSAIINHPSPTHPNQYVRP